MDRYKRGRSVREEKTRTHEIALWHTHTQACYFCAEFRQEREKKNR